MNLEEGMWLRPSVTHIKGRGRSAARRGPGLQGEGKGKSDPEGAEGFYFTVIRLKSVSYPQGSREWTDGDTVLLFLGSGCYRCGTVVIIYRVI